MQWAWGSWADFLAVVKHTSPPDSAGQFYECLNMAALYKLPHIFVVENNKWAIGMQHMRATAPTMGDEEPFIYKKGPPFGMHGVLVDGMDVLKARLSLGNIS
jgi:pyruvate dehydrogenase E1 component alpha subunit